jgi:hypothetical protein
VTTTAYTVVSPGGVNVSIAAEVPADNFARPHSTPTVPNASGQPAPVSSANPMPTALPATTGADWSNSAPSLLATLKTIPANAARIGFSVQNQSAATLQIVLDHDGTGSNYTVWLVDPGAGANRQGGDWSFAQAGIRHSGQIRICGATGSQLAAWEF